MTHLFSPTRIGPYDLDHRVVMAPLTRMRASVGDVPNDLIAEYYSQRATAGGLIVSEGTPVAPEGYGYARAPGMFTDAQREGWRKITGAVHAKEGRIFAQLWHVGRQSNPMLQPNGEDPIAPSASQAPGMGIALSGPVPFAPARALRLEEIAPNVAQFGHAARLAKEAGFDGVEIHGANGYLPDQFLQDGTNQRTDRYGGSLENRARFMLEVTEAAADVFGARAGRHATDAQRHVWRHERQRSVGDVQPCHASAQ